MPSRIAVITMVQNDDLFLRLWCFHYRRVLPDAELFIIDHNSVGDGRDAVQYAQRECNARVFPAYYRFSFHAEWVQRTLGDFRDYLLQSGFQAVVYSPVDGLLAVDPTLAKVGTLAELVEVLVENPAVAVTAKGFEVVHQRTSEQRLQFFKPILPQRRLWYHSRLYTIPVCWTSKDPQPKHKAVSGLRMVHLHKADFVTCLDRHRERSSRLWWPPARNAGRYRHNMIEDQEMLQKWFLSHADDTTQVAKLSEIPASLKDQL